MLFYYVMFEKERRGNIENQIYLDNSRVIYKVIFFFNEIFIDFFDVLKLVIKGYVRYDLIVYSWMLLFNNCMKNCKFYFVFLIFL